MSSSVGHPASAVARKLQELSGNALTPLQLIKLVYLCHGWMLGLYGRALIKEPVEAWQYGPVIPSLYDKMKKYRSSPVSEPVDTSTADFDEDEESVIDQVFEKYSHLNGVALSRLTHHDGSPWAITWKSGLGRSGRISNDLIRDHFANLANDTPASQP